MGDFSCGLRALHFWRNLLAPYNLRFQSESSALKLLLARHDNMLEGVEINCIKYDFILKSNKIDFHNVYFDQNRRKVGTHKNRWIG